MKGKYLLFSILTVMAIVAFVGCSDDNDSGTNSSDGIPSEMVGVWMFDSVTVNNALQSMSDFFEWEPNTVKAYATLNADSTHKYEEFDDLNNVLWYDEGTVVINGQSMTMQVTSENGVAVTPYTTFDGTWVLNGTNLLFTMVDGADTVRIYLSKVVS